MTLVPAVRIRCEGGDSVVVYLPKVKAHHQDLTAAMT
jgi:hypothetical protein